MPVVGNPAYRKSTPPARPGRAGAARPAAYKARPGVAPPANRVGKSEEEVASHVRPSVSPSLSSLSPLDVSLLLSL